MRRALVLMAVASLAGCAGRKTALPLDARLEVPGGWRDDPGSTAAVSERWWTEFHDPVLTALVDRALANNVDLSVAVARVSEARATSRLAHAQLRPSVGLGLAGLAERSLSPFGSGEFQLAGEPQTTASYDVDLFGRLASADAAERRRLLASSYAADAVKLSVAAAVAKGYILLRALDARRDVAVETLTDRLAASRIARRRAAAGYTSILEREQAEAEYRATAQLIPEVELAITRQENALNVLVGEAPGSVKRGLPLSSLVLPAVPPGLPADLLRRRPDVAQAEQLLVASDHELDASRAAFLPSVRLTGSVGTLLSTLLANPVAVWSAGVGVLAPIFEGGRLTARVDATTARRDQAAFAFKGTALAAFRDVEDNLASVRRTSEQASQLRERRSALSRALRVAMNRYAAGYSPYLDQLDAERGLLAADLALVQTDSDRLIATVSLFAALGGGWWK